MLWVCSTWMLALNDMWIFWWAQEQNSSRFVWKRAIHKSHLGDSDFWNWSQCVGIPPHSGPTHLFCFAVALEDASLPLAGRLKGVKSRNGFHWLSLLPFQFAIKFGYTGIPEKSDSFIWIFWPEQTEFGARLSVELAKSARGSTRGLASYRWLVACPKRPVAGLPIRRWRWWSVCQVACLLARFFLCWPTNFLQSPQVAEPSARPQTWHHGGLSMDGLLKFFLR